MSNELDTDSVQPPEEMANKVVDRSECRDPKTGQFVAGWKGGGRPKGSKDKLNMQVISTMERLWAQRGDEIMDHLASERPEILAGLVAKLIPQSLAAEAISGEKGEGNQGDRDVTVRVITQQHQDVLPPREVDGELMHDDDGANVTH